MKIRDKLNEAYNIEYSYQTVKKEFIIKLISEIADNTAQDIIRSY